MADENGLPPSTETDELDGNEDTETAENGILWSVKCLSLLVFICTALKCFSIIIVEDVSPSIQIRLEYHSTLIIRVAR